MKLRAVTFALAAVLAAGCSPKTETAATTGTPAAPAPADTTAYHTDLPLAELMGHVIDHAADGVWLSQGWIIDKDGEHELFPTTDKGWADASNSAVTLAEASNLLKLPARQVDSEYWPKYADALYRAAMITHEAAEKREKQPFFDGGGKIYEVCKDCHQRYILGDETAPVPE